MGSDNKDKGKDNPQKHHYHVRNDPDMSEGQAISETAKFIVKAWLCYIFPAAILLYVISHFFWR